MSLLCDNIDGFPVNFKEKSPLKGFRYPVFHNKEFNINYYVIEKPTYVLKSKVEYEFRKDKEEPEDGSEYFSLDQTMSKDLLDHYYDDGYRKLFILLKGPTLNYIKGTVLEKTSYKKNKMYMGLYVSNRDWNFKSLMFSTKEMTFIKKET